MSWPKCSFRSFLRKWWNKLFGLPTIFLDTIVSRSLYQTTCGPQWEYFVSPSLKEIYILSSFPTCEPLCSKPPFLISSGQLKLNIWQIHLCPQSPTNMGNCHPSASICFHFVLIPVICSHIATGYIIDNTLHPPRNVKRMDSMLACAPWEKAVTDVAHLFVLLFICVPQILKQHSHISVNILFHFLT